MFALGMDLSKWWLGMGDPLALWRNFFVQNGGPKIKKLRPF
jgi:hypothetical protein